MDHWEFLMRLGIAVVLGGLIGIEREVHRRPAGFRTHILVCTGSALVMEVSLGVFMMYPLHADPGRIAAQVVSGIGFLGAGTIMREGLTVQGLTTAASLWAASGIGLAAGAGMHAPAVVVTILVLATLTLFSRLERKLIPNRGHQSLVMTIKDRPGMVGEIGSLLGRLSVSIRNITIQSSEAEDLMELELQLRLPPNLQVMTVVERLKALDGVYKVKH